LKTSGKKKVLINRILAYLEGDEGADSSESKDKKNKDENSD